MKKLHRTLEKQHLCEHINLLQLVWDAMVQEFIAQYKILVKRIYSFKEFSMITMAFTTDDILIISSDIAKSH